jgi:hypothetical protein
MPILIVSSASSISSAIVVVRFLSRPSERGAVSGQDLAASVAGNLSHGGSHRALAIWRSGRLAGVALGHRRSSRDDPRHCRRSRPHRHRQRRAGRHQHRGAAVSQSRHAERDRGSLLSRRGLRLRGDRLRNRERRGRFRRPDPDELPQRPTALLYVTPSHQYPTGHTLSLDRRHAIVAWARRYGCYILEDDRDGDFRYEGSPLQAIAAPRRTARSISGLFRARSAPDCGLAIWSCPSSSPASLPRRKGFSTTAIPGSNRPRLPR